MSPQKTALKQFGARHARLLWAHGLGEELPPSLLVVLESGKPASFIPLNTQESVILANTVRESVHYEGTLLGTAHSSFHLAVHTTQGIEYAVVSTHQRVPAPLLIALLERFRILTAEEVAREVQERTRNDVGFSTIFPAIRIFDETEGHI